MAQINFKSRHQTVANQLGGAWLLTSDGSDVRWLTGFVGSAGTVLVGQNETTLIVDPRYVDEAYHLSSVIGRRVNVRKVDSVQQIAEVASTVVGTNKLLVNPTKISWAQVRELAGANIQLAPMEDDLILASRLLKDEYEIAATTRALEIAERAFELAVLEADLPCTEIVLASALDAEMSRLGSEQRAFDTIVASGPNATRPHNTPTSRVIQPGEPVVIDWGATVDGYRSDSSRTITFGPPSSRTGDALLACEAALVAAIGMIAAGVTYGDVKRCADQVLSQAGFGDNTLHPFGHNVGLDIHERPYFENSETAVIAAGNVLAVEPGIYAPEFGGVRIEDLVFVTELGGFSQNKLPRQMVL